MNRKDVRNHNLQKIRSALRSMRQATKPQLAEHTGLSVMTVNTLVKILQERGEVELMEDFLPSASEEGDARPGSIVILPIGCWPLSCASTRRRGKTEWSWGQKIFLGISFSLRRLPAMRCFLCCLHASWLFVPPPRRSRSGLRRERTGRPFFPWACGGSIWAPAGEGL